jgi:hypothetical protein
MTRGTPSIDTIACTQTQEKHEQTVQHEEIVQRSVLELELELSVPWSEHATN